MRFLAILFFYYFFSSVVIAQDQQTNVKSKHSRAIDSLAQKLRIDSAHTYRFKKFRPYLSIDNRNSFIKSVPVNFRGFQFGLIFKENHTLGLGFYRIIQNSQRPVKTKDNKTNTIVNQYLSLNYTTFFYQYAIYKKRFWEIDIPFEIGFGRADLKIEDSLTKTTLRHDIIPILPLGCGLQVIFKPVKWVGVSFMGGYRYVQDKDKRLNFNGTYYSIGLWIDFRQIYRDIKYYGFIKKRYHRKIKTL